MSYYDFNTDIIGTQLIPPQLRKPKHIAWIKVLLSQIQRAWSLFFTDFMTGANYPRYIFASVYLRGDRTIWVDGAVYECIKSNPGPFDFPTGAVNSAVYWIKTQDIFIGLQERLQYNGQYIVLNHAITKFFGANCKVILNPPASAYAYQVSIPIATYNALGNTAPQREAAVRSFVDQYTFLGPTYEVTTF